jgi:hypothetical protein
MIVITESDMDKLDKLIDSSMYTRVPDREHLNVLREELDRAHVVDGEVAPPNVVVERLDQGHRSWYGPDP